MTKATYKRALNWVRIYDGGVEDMSARTAERPHLKPQAGEREHTINAPAFEASRSAPKTIPRSRRPYFLILPNKLGTKYSNT